MLALSYCSVVISTDGLMWMGMTDDCLMYCATVRNITLWNLNQFYDFFAVARSRICRLSLATCENKTTRVVAEGQDSRLWFYTVKDLIEISSSATNGFFGTKGSLEIFFQ